MNYTFSILSAFILLIGVNRQSHSQSVNKKPPKDSKKISLPTSQGIYGTWDYLGFSRGERLSNFTMHTEEGKPFRLYKELKKGKPLVFINASYTCDISRYNLGAIKSLWRQYGKAITFVMVYTIEAHPADAASPYSALDKVWLAENNLRDGIEAPQPKFYKERVELANVWKEAFNINIVVLVDTPRNMFWMNFGQAPNMVYIINPDKTVYYRQTWFDEQKLEKNIQLLVD